METQQELEDFILQKQEDDTTYDVAHLDRILIVQFKNAPDKLPMRAVDYINDVVTNFFQVLAEYDKNINAKETPPL